jgi:hypothetical protein
VRIYITNTSSSFHFTIFICLFFLPQTKQFLTYSFYTRCVEVMIKCAFLHIFSNPHNIPPIPTYSPHSSYTSQHYSLILVCPLFPSFVHYCWNYFPYAYILIYKKLSFLESLFRLLTFLKLFCIQQRWMSVFAPCFMIPPLALLDRSPIGHLIPSESLTVDEHYSWMKKPPEALLVDMDIPPCTLFLDEEPLLETQGGKDTP